MSTRSLKSAEFSIKGWLHGRDPAAGANIKNFRWHDLRHTFESRLVMAGVDIRTVQELMGHKTIQVTLPYAHLAPQHQLEAVQRLCDTGVAPTDTRTSTSGSESFSTSATRPN